MICPHITLATRLEVLVDSIIEFATVVRLLPDSCPSTDLTPGVLEYPFAALAGSNIRCKLGPSDTSVDFTFLDIDRLL